MAQYPLAIGQTLFAALQENGLTVDTPCGGKGICGKCKVQIIAGEIAKPSSEERRHLSEQELSEGIRFSCQFVPAGDLTIRFLSANDIEHRILSGGFVPSFEKNPSISKQVFPVASTLTAQSGSYLDFAAEILDISEVAAEPHLLQSIKQVLEHDRLTAVYAGNRLIGLEGGDTQAETYGLAVDIGTTTVVVSLVDLHTGRELDSATALNPQKTNGQDVLSRIEFARKADNGLKILHESIIDCLNTVIGRLCTKNNVARERIYDVTVAANTTMLHLLLGVDPTPIGKSPYIPVFTGHQSLSAAAVGLHLSPCARLYCLPGVSGYIGADIVAGVNVCQLDKNPRNVLFIDIGTNGEIVLSKGGTLYACACAAGPALEGMNISCGMLAGEGAVERVHISKSDIRLQTIGGGSPQGMCGSGVIEAVAEMARVGLMEKTGRLKSRKTVREDAQLQGLASFLAEDNSKRSLILDPDQHLLITQADVRQVQLAKGAILSGIHALLNQLDMKTEDLDALIISGQFGRHLRVDSLVDIGLIPSELREKVTYVGNSSKTGALMCLLSTEKRVDVEKLAQRIQHFELPMLKDYEKIFSGCLMFR